MTAAPFFEPLVSTHKQCAFVTLKPMAECRERASVVLTQEARDRLWGNPDFFLEGRALCPAHRTRVNQILGGVELDKVIREWIIEQHGRPDDPKSVEWWQNNILTFDHDRMVEWTGFDAVLFGIACEGAYDWTSYIWIALRDEWFKRGFYLEPFNGWLLAVYPAT